MHAGAEDGNPRESSQNRKSSKVYLAGSFRNCTADGTFRSVKRSQPTEVAILQYRKKVDNLAVSLSLCISRKFYVVHRWMDFGSMAVQVYAHYKYCTVYLVR